MLPEIIMTSLKRILEVNFVRRMKPRNLFTCLPLTIKSSKLTRSDYRIGKKQILRPSFGYPGIKKVPGSQPILPKTQYVITPCPNWVGRCKGLRGKWELWSGLKLVVPLS